MVDAMAFTLADAARASGIGRTSLYELIGAGKIEARKCGNRTLIPADSLRGYLANLPAADIRTGRRKELPPAEQVVHVSPRSQSTRTITGRS